MGALLLATTVAGCGSEPGWIDIQNDLGRSIEVSFCSDHLCNGELPPLALSHRALRSAQASLQQGCRTSIWFASWDGTRLGCLPLVMPEPSEGVVTKTSQAVPCRKSYDEEHLWPPE